MRALARVCEATATAATLLEGASLPSAPSADGTECRYSQTSLCESSTVTERSFAFTIVVCEM